VNVTNHLGESRIDEARSRALAATLYHAYRSGEPVEPLTAADSTLGLAEGYAIQRALVDLLLADGEQVVGYKVGLTSAAMQELLGVDQPDFGPLFASGVHSSPAVVPLERFIAPRIEAEIGVLLGSDLSGPTCTVGDVRSATEGIIAALEIVDSRIAQWRIQLADTVADLASGRAFVLSNRIVPLTDWQPRLTGVVFRRNGDVVATGAGAAALGDPLAVVAWLANTLFTAGVTLRAGEIIMTGALHAMVPMEPGDHFIAEFDRIGSVEATAIYAS